MQFDFIRPLTAAEYASLKADIEAHGQEFAIVRDQHGVTLDGHHREKILAELGIPARIETRDFADDDARRAFVLSANLHRRQLKAEDRKKLVEMLAEQGKTQLEVAKELGVSQQTVSSDLGQLPKVVNQKHAKTTANPRGAGRPKKAPPPPNIVQAQRSINTTPEEWERFKHAAEREGVSVADKLGALVRGATATETMVSVHVLIEELHPLFERVREQSQRHLAMLSKSELATIASEGKRLLDGWASDDPTVRRVRGRVVPPVSRQRKEAPDGNLL